MPTIEELQQSLHQYDQRITVLENNNKAFMSALDEACKALITNNMVRVMLSAEVRGKIESYLTSRGVQYGKEAETK